MCDFKEGKRPAGLVLGTQQRHVGGLQKFFGIIAVARCHGDTDSGADDDGMALKQIGIGDRIEQPAQHGKYIGVQAGKDVFLAQHGPPALCHAT